MSVLPVGFGSEVASGYQIERSLRFNSADSTYLSETFGTPTNNRIWTWSGWVKRSLLGSAVFGHLFSHYTSATANNYFYFNADTLYYGFDNGTVYALITSAVFRDPSAWYHIMLVTDTTQATASQRTKIYVNAIQQTVTGSYVPQNTDTYLNRSGRNVTIGRRSAAADQYFNGYLTEINFIDGQALTPSDFGETDSATGVWKPKAYSGTYGNNGFELLFADNSGTTSTTLGVDSSGNGNNWTPNNFSVTAGAGNDSLVDSPTSYGTDTGAGGEVRGNYCTWNALKNSTTLSDGNLRSFNSSTTQWLGVVGTVGMTSGKWYWECTPTVAATVIIGLANSAYSTGGHPGSDANSWGYYSANGNKYFNNSGSSYGATYTANDVIGVAFDADAGTLTFYKNGVSQGTAYSSLTSGPYFPAVGVLNSQILFINAGQRPFEKWNGSAYVANTAPSGFKALCTQNLPTPTIGATSTTQANDYMNVVTYTGNGTTTGNTQSITGVGFQPDFTWIKSRSAGTQWHLLNDAIRGTNKLLYSNDTSAEASVTNVFNSFNADGFTVAYNSAYTSAQSNANGSTYVAWNWKANGAGSSNTAGTITSTVSANTTSGFSIVTYTGTGANATVGHGLGAIPAMIMVKNRDSGAIGGAVYHTSMGATKYLKLFQTTTGTDGEATDNTAWNGSSPTFNSTVFSVGSLNRTNSSQQMVAYCFAPVAGYSAFGSYTGNAAADGPFVYANHRPAFVLIKRTDTTSNWTILDFQREGYNVDNDPLFPNLSNAEGTTDLADLLSNGFKLRSTDASVNASGGTYIYMSLASNPFKYSLAR